jgi:Fe-S oxidoreductase/nitrate reductase gamma subunit
MLPTREIYWNITGGGLIYLLAAVAVGLLAYGIYLRVRLWRLGGSESRFDRLAERAGGLLFEVFGHRRSLRDPYPGVAHLFIFYGFLAQLVATSLIALQEWTGVHFLKGAFYLGFSLLSDGFGILGLVGLGMALWHRAVRRPARLHSVMDDWIALGLLLLLFLQGFLVEGIRIAVTELRQQPGLAPWSPGGYAVALLLRDTDPERLRTFHRFHWWFHALTAFVFLAYLAWGKLGHIGYGLMNIFLRNLDSSGRLAYPDIEATMEADPEAIQTLGVERIDQYSWKSLADLDACMSCGRCEEVCPAHVSGVPLSPRKLIRDLKEHLTAVGPSMLELRSSGTERADPPAAESGLPPLFGEPAPGARPPAVLEEELWGCRTCGACQQECPVYIEHVPKLVDMRRYLVMMESRMSDEARQLLKNIDDRMHPWVGAQRSREEWFEDLDVKVLAHGGRAEYLFWVGCTGSMIDRNVEVTRAMVRVLTAAGVDFAILGAEEACTGDPARRVGGEFTFQTCAKRNIEVLDGYGVEKILATCPHCFNTFKNEYPDFGGRYEVIHHTQLLRELIRSGRLELEGAFDSLTYHDSCYLGRHNGIYDAPREILRGLSTRGGFVELARSRSRSLCCGAGGGYAWMADDPSQRINHIRLQEVQACGARTTAVSCPFCLQMFDDALSALDPERALRTVDIAELVADSLKE